MTKRIVLGVMALPFVVLYVIGIIGLATNPDGQAVPTPHSMVVSGVLAMFATLGFFVVGFVQTSTQGDD
jgi:hypothetical protein